MNQWNQINYDPHKDFNSVLEELRDAKLTVQPISLDQILIDGIFKDGDELVYLPHMAFIFEGQTGCISFQEWSNKKNEEFTAFNPHHRYIYSR